MAGQNKASMRRKLRSALAHKRLADSILDSISLTQKKWNATLDKLDVDGDAPVLNVDAEATLNLTADITLTDATTSGADRNTNTLTLEVEAPAANNADEVLVDVTGTAEAIVITVTPNDGTNNSLTPVDLTTAELVELINTGDVVGKTIVLTDASGLLDNQTAAGGDATALADGGEGDGEVATFSGGVTANAGLDTDYEADGTISSSEMFEADREERGSQHMATLRKSLRSALAHRKLADELADSLEEMQTAYNALLVKLDAEAGTLDDGDYEDTLSLSPLEVDGEGEDAQHKASLRRSLRSALANESLADELIDAIRGLQKSFNDALALIDSAAINGAMAALKVEVISPDGE